ncbi:hypothetical protein H257_02658 [Aphanomyces astaci]|uniref:Uncharacterized protein n=1 Tax=Aphanomyces astaci TaxID=112090 RepID=W4H509_APHAT|nr:hypothetical protein H257_02658 [Aphanomyces astaci]ETV86228.1 hypothetical protein H257_02658 [Aphanomyces astaci]|eukprot:XP_009824700.1 hypothetical protein H257_02658 [Aphanomyces astaci]
MSCNSFPIDGYYDESRSPSVEQMANVRSGFEGTNQGESGAGVRNSLDHRRDSNLGVFDVHQVSPAFQRIGKLRDAVGNIRRHQVRHVGDDGSCFAINSIAHPIRRIDCVGF